MLNGAPIQRFFFVDFSIKPKRAIFYLFINGCCYSAFFSLSPPALLLSRPPSAVNILCTSCANQPFCCAQQLIYVLISIKRKCAGAWRMCNWSFAASIRFVHSQIHMDFVYICTQKATHLYTTFTPRIHYQLWTQNTDQTSGIWENLRSVYCSRNGSRFEWPRFDLNCLPPHGR